MADDLDQLAAKYGVGAPAADTAPTSSDDLDSLASKYGVGAPAAVSPPSSAAPAPTAGFFERGWESLKRGAQAVGHVAKEQGELLGDIVTHPIDTARRSWSPEGLAKTAAQRREFERGVDDMVTLGYGQRLADKVGSLAGSNDLGEPQRQLDAQAAPGYRTTGSLVGGMLPGAARAIGEAGGAAAKTIAPVLTRAAEVPGLGTIARTLAPAVKGVAGYEASAPLIAGLSSSADGHRLEAAKEAATDPAGLLLSGVGPVASETVGAVAKSAGNAAKNFVERAPEEVDSWLVKDLRGQSKGEVTPTQRKYLASDEDDVVAAVKSDPRLARVIEEARFSDKPALEKAVSTVRDEMSSLMEPKPQLYQQHVDANLPEGGIVSGDFVDKLREAAKEHRASGTRSGHAMADQIDKQIETIEKSRDWGATDKVELPKKLQEDLTDLQKIRANVKDPDTLAAIDAQIADIQRQGKSVPTFDRGKVVPTELARTVVTDLQGAAFDGLGGLASTRANRLSRIIAGDGKAILDGYLDQAAKANPEARAAVDQIRAMNARFSALKNISTVLEQRLGKATENATGSTPTSLHDLKRDLLHPGGLAGAAVLAGTGHPVLGAATLLAPAAIKAGINGARAATRAASEFAQSPAFARSVQALQSFAARAGSADEVVRQAAQLGIGANDARKIYDQAQSANDDRSYAQRVAEALRSGATIEQAVAAVRKK